MSTLNDTLNSLIQFTLQSQQIAIAKQQERRAAIVTASQQLLLTPVAQRSKVVSDLASNLGLEEDLVSAMAVNMPDSREIMTNQLMRDAINAGYISPMSMAASMANMPLSDFERLTEVRKWQRTGEQPLFLAGIPKEEQGKVLTSLAKTLAGMPQESIAYMDAINPVQLTDEERRKQVLIKSGIEMTAQDRASVALGYGNLGARREEQKARVDMFNVETGLALMTGKGGFGGAGGGMSVASLDNAELELMKQRSNVTAELAKAGRALTEVDRLGNRLSPTRNTEVSISSAQQNYTALQAQVQALDNRIQEVRTRRAAAVQQGGASSVMVNPDRPAAGAGSGVLFQAPSPWAPLPPRF